ncbi:uncharacterized protein CANTADRAFT_56841 [Suhomyces tanzawaensis NRRL Y-17324]|uniref:Phytanoyl-CoA dioxygenase n=1 Tax=Suhomyces tanzawaensis NRRL Y-17324 TaxID=984487 RepID=A0A1E4SBW8_9ASCO|nr:uncharacterized protein CANTADRAFT_56841 [Suhomyces tanzawaensis NRRL Y-17324]ODV76999.1 hypothetical protein CANTADRAFT_56841 [Suhomyces tanzawaensis NRRL Y-17324]
MPAQIPHYHHDQIAENGFTVIRGFLSPQEVAQYLEASEAVVQLARDGDWPHVRTRGKQFPPWPKNFSPDIWGVSGLLHPDLGKLALPFHEVYSSDKILDVAGDILQISKDGLSMELMNMLINPLTNFGLDWHRDTIKPEVTEAEEAEQLADIGASAAGAQFNLALTEDKCLIVIPKSHNRVRTAEEREKTINGDRKEHISGQITVDLKPGDIVFYNNNILHRGEYDSSSKRITLHGSYGHVGYGKSRAKGILQHGVAEWLPRFEPETENLQMLKEKLVKLAEEFKGVDVGFALDG